MARERLNFDSLALTEIEVTVGDKEYLLREATGQAVIDYRNSQFQGAKTDRKGRFVGFNDLATSDYVLLSSCLVEVQQTEKGQMERRVEYQELIKWPNEILDKLVTKLKEISGISEEEETPEAINEKIKELQEKLTDLAEEETPVKN